MKPSLTINLVFLSTPSVPILQEKTSTPITYLGRSTHCVRGVTEKPVYNNPRFVVIKKHGWTG